MNNFRSAEFWKTSILTLSENAFFELIRTVFGKIKTPFNKQKMLADLEKFLLRSDIQKNIACYIDKNDTLIISAVAALNEPTPEELDSFLLDETNLFTLHNTVVNLEERFILYRFTENEQRHIALNPLLEKILLPYTADRELLFPSYAEGTLPLELKTEKKAEGFLFDDRVLAALFSFVGQNKLFYREGREGGKIRRKIASEAESLFPGLPLEIIIGGLTVLGLFSANGEQIAVDHQRFAAFGSISFRERMEYCAAGIWRFCSSRELSGPAEFSPWLVRPQIHHYAEFIHNLINLLEPERLYPASTLHRLTYILKRAYEEIKVGRLVEAMETAGLLESFSGLYRLKPLSDCPPSENGPVIAMDTPFTAVLYPEIAYNDALQLAVVSRVVEAGPALRFELCRDSAVSAFNRGISATAVIEHLRRLSGNRIDENLVFALRDWEKRHGEVTLRKGLILTLSPERRYLAETKPLSGLIVETLAPGIYMLSEAAEKKAAEVLQKAGVSIIARREPAENIPLRNFYLTLGNQQPRPKETLFSEANTDSAAVLIKDFHSILEKMRLGREERNELTARVNRKLILSDTQLQDTVIHYEKLEAGGLDYVGKTLIVKQAIAVQAMVEVIWPGRQKQERIYGIPAALEKTGSENILVLNPIDSGDVCIAGDTIRVPLGKISYLRQIKKSIFEKQT